MMKEIIDDPQLSKFPGKVQPKYQSIDGKEIKSWAKCITGSEAHIESDKGSSYGKKL